MACVEDGAVAKSERKVAFMVILMVITFLMSWMPYATLALLVVSSPDVNIPPLVGTVPVYLAKSSTVYNPIIYIYMNKQVHRKMSLKNVLNQLSNTSYFVTPAPSSGDS